MGNGWAKMQWREYCQEKSAEKISPDGGQGVRRRLCAFELLEDASGRILREDISSSSASFLS